MRPKGWPHSYGHAAGGAESPVTRTRHVIPLTIFRKQKVLLSPCAGAVDAVQVLALNFQRGVDARLRLDTFWQQHLKNMDFMKSSPYELGGLAPSGVG